MLTQTTTLRGGTPAVIDVTERTFQTEVIERSRQTPVVIDFRAPWCGPCRTLGPTLEKLANEAKGAFVLAKINVDENPRLSQAVQVQGIPAVMAVRDGRLVDQFEGAQPESWVRAWLKGVLETQTDADDPLADIKALETTQPDEAAAHYRLVLGSDPDNAEAQFRLGRLLLLQGNPEAIALLDQIASDSPFFDQAGALLPLAPFFAAVEGRLDTLRERVTRDPSDLEANFQLAAALGRDEQHAEALELLLGIVRRNRAFRDDGARKAMVGLFALIGEEVPLVHEYRRTLANALF